MLDAVVARLEEEIPALKGRVKGIADYGKMLNDAHLPGAPWFVFIIPSQIRAQKPTAISGYFSQALTENIVIVVGFRSANLSTLSKVEICRERLFEVVNALCGWAPAGATGVFELQNIALASFTKGIAFYHIAISISTQLRILQ